MTFFAGYSLTTAGNRDDRVLVSTGTDMLVAAADAVIPGGAPRQEFVCRLGMSTLLWIVGLQARYFAFIKYLL